MYIYLYVSVCSSFFAEFEYRNTLLILVEISTVADNKKLTLRFHFYDRGTVVR